MHSTIGSRAALMLLGIVWRPVSADAQVDDELGPSRVDTALRPIGVERHEHSPRPTLPQPQRPDESTPANVDTNRPFLDWQHATDDWWGWRPWLDDRGLVTDASLTLDVSRNFSGGVSTSDTISRHLFDVNLTADTERLWGWVGGTFFVDFQSFDGETGDEIVGDYQIFSNIDTQPVTQLPQLWFEQWMFEEQIRIKIGMVDANSEFAYTEHGVEFLNSSMGFSPTIFVFPTYPDPATSLNAFWYPNGQVYVGVGVYDGAGQRGVPTGSRGPRSLLDEKLFTIGEAGATWTAAASLSGRAAVGGWYHNGEFDAFDGTTHTGTAGWYLVVDQFVFRECPHEEGNDQGAGVFFQYGRADESISEVSDHLGGGLAWRGVIPTRDADSLGAGVTWVRFSDAGAFAFSSETATEFFYKLKLTNWASITFDLQYIRHPGGVAGRKDALVGTSRFTTQF